MIESNASKVAVLAVPMLIAVILLLSHTPGGAALSMDSLSYVQVARNILFGNGISLPTFAMQGEGLTPMTVWPPGYPMILSVALALGSVAGAPTEAAIAALNVALLLTSAAIFFFLLRRTVSATVAGIVTLAMVLMPSSQLVYTYAWSECLFLPLCLMGYWCLLRTLDEVDGRQLVATCLMVVSFLAATYVRYVGVAFIGAAVAGLVLFGAESLRGRLTRPAAASAAFALGLAPLFWRNVRSSGELSGMDRGASDAGFTADVADLIGLVYLDFVNQPLLVGLTVFLASGAAIAWLWVRGGRTEAPGSSLNAAAIRPTILPFLFAVGYFAFLLVSRQIQVIDLDTRMLSVAVPFLLLAAVGAYHLLCSRASQAASMIPFVLPILLLVWNAVGTHQSILAGWRESGEPGRVLGGLYPSISAHRFAPLREVASSFPMAPGAEIFTDISRPMVFQFLYGDSTIRQVSGAPDDDLLARIEAYDGREGLAIVGSQARWPVLTRQFSGRSDIYTVNGLSGTAEWLILTLPVASP